MTHIGAFTFVLHSHLPYTRKAGRWPHGEEWIHEAAAETYLPLIDALGRLQAKGVRHCLTLGLSPVLLEQLADLDVRRNFSTYLDDRIRAAAADVPRFEAAGDQHMTYLAQTYHRQLTELSQHFHDRYDGNLVPAFKALLEADVIEVVTCAATHGYLPLLDRDESINLQLATAVAAHRRHLGRAPRAIWLPECAYRPGYITDDGRQRPGIEDFLARHDLRLFFAETHMIEGGQPVGVAAGEAIGPYGAIKRRYLIPRSAVTPPNPATTYLPYYVAQPEVAVIGRNNKTGLQVWSAEWGYPGDFDYREFHKKDGISGMQYWRVTGAGIDLADKDTYHPDWAAGKVRQHAAHFSGLVSELLHGYHSQAAGFGIISANYDTELFGHWWAEGISWLEAVLEHLAGSPDVELITAPDYLADHPPETVLNLPEGSWGAGGTHFVWDNADTHWMWPVIHEAEVHMLNTVRANPRAKEMKSKVLNQAARELLLLQSSDWPFLVSTGQAGAYAVQRFQEHLERFEVLVRSVDAGKPDVGLAQELWERDKVFPDIDYHWYQP